MRWLIAPDSFKGCMSAEQAAAAIVKGIRSVDPQAKCITLPISDGGEGFVDSLLTYVDGTKVSYNVTNPNGVLVEASFGWVEERKLAIIEVAAASGLTLIDPKELNPLQATSYGTGELIVQALELGCVEIWIGLGGSATSDGGIGIAQALGYRFMDESQQELPVGFDLSKAISIDYSKCHPRLHQVKFAAACDVDAPLYGVNGSAYVFAPQKGADTAMVKLIDDNLRHLDQLIANTLQLKVGQIAGSGAAGGIGAGLLAFCGAELRPGSDFLFDAVGLDDKLQECDVVIVGEGRTDAQSAMGKAPVSLAKRASAFELPVLCLSGGLGDGYDTLRLSGVTALLSVTPGPVSLEEAIANGEAWLCDAATQAAAWTVAISRINTKGS